MRSEREVAGGETKEGEGFAIEATFLESQPINIIQ